MFYPGTGGRDERSEKVDGGQVVRTVADGMVDCVYCLGYI